MAHPVVRESKSEPCKLLFVSSFLTGCFIIVFFLSSKLSETFVKMVNVVRYTTRRSWVYSSDSSPSPWPWAWLFGAVQIFKTPASKQWFRNYFQKLLRVSLILTECFIFFFRNFIRFQANIPISQRWKYLLIVVGFQVFLSDTNNLLIVLWFQLFLSNRNNLLTFIWFQVFLSNTNNLHMVL